MRSLIVKDDGDLHRLERAIAEFKSRPPAEQLRKHFLLDALRRERTSLRRSVAYHRGATLGDLDS
jgi:hypothetical protein